MQRPVWLFSLDSERFEAVPMTTGGLAAYFAKYGSTAERTSIELVHFFQSEDIAEWFEASWNARFVYTARKAFAEGLQPVVGFSFYSWNTAEFLALIKSLRSSCPGLLVVGGGPHVQLADEFLSGDCIDVVAVGEGEQTFQELLDCENRESWYGVAGLAFLGSDAEVHRTPPRARHTRLDDLPSALDIVELRDAGGNPRYKAVGYETSRGCPHRCAYCEWGTGATGTKVYHFSPERIRDDLERLAQGGVEDIWFCDSNFGAFKQDLEKARILIDLRKRTGRPNNFATSWSKHHNRRTQEIVMLLFRSGMIHHYNLALQTMTPLALELSHRKNMKTSQVESVAKIMAEAGVPIAAELIWGLPGDNLTDFEANLDRLEALFPNINIFGYILLPGTEFYSRRKELEIETIPVAGYGKAKGEYVVRCITFCRQEGIEGYFLITSYIVLIRGNVIPLTARFLALEGSVPVSPLLRALLGALVDEFKSEMPRFDMNDKMVVYENRSALYLLMLAQESRCFSVISRVVDTWLETHTDNDELKAQVSRVVKLDLAFCPKVGPKRTIDYPFDFSAERVSYFLGRMELPPVGLFCNGLSQTLRIAHPAQVGEILMDPDGGSWMRGQIVS
ncbi:MAG: B12-binding domain-containing radical SAM protein [Deltaproteobacteria bacterium]|nr:B12-binding domain-containing radical SAM protein [Deltaproteobacteria bacterium]